MCVCVCVCACACLYVCPCVCMGGMSVCVCIAIVWCQKTTGVGPVRGVNRSDDAHPPQKEALETTHTQVHTHHQNITTIMDIRYADT